MFRGFLIVAAVLMAVVTGVALSCSFIFDNYTAAPAGAQVPSHFQMKETFLSKAPFVPMTMVIVSGGQSYGEVKKSVFSWTTTFTLKDQTGVEQAKARMEAFTLLTKIDVSDAQGHAIGSMHEEFFGSWLPNRTVYRILDGTGNEMAVSDKIDWFGTDIILKDKGGNPLAVLHRGFWNFFRHTWDVTIVQPNVVDLRIIEMMPAFKTAADNKHNSSSGSHSHK